MISALAAPAGATTQWTEVGPATGSGALPNVAVTHVAIFNPPGQPSRLRVSTYGRGVWEMPLPGSNAPDFSISVSDVDLVTYPGQAATYNGILTSVNGYGSPVTLSCDASSTLGSGSVPGTCNPTPASVTPASSGTAFTVTAGNASTQDFSFRIVGTGSNSLIRQVPVTLRVVDYSLGVPQPSSISVVRGNSTTVTMSHFDGFF